MISIQLSEDYEEKLEQIARRRNLGKDEFIKIMLRQYVDSYFRKGKPFDLGEDLFGKYGSGKTDRSQTYKRLLKEKLSGKHAH